MTHSETIAPAAGQYHSDLPAEELIAQISHLRREKNAVILAHNYQIPPIQDLADFTGDSLGLSVEAAKTDAERIVFCGVHFMAESAKILSPGKQVFLPHLGAGCSLADSITPESLDDWESRLSRSHGGDVCQLHGRGEGRVRHLLHLGQCRLSGAQPR